MSCKRFSEAITDHACGAALEEPLARHLKTCAGCTRSLEDQRQALATAEGDLRQALSVTASPDFAARVSERVRATATEGNGLHRLWFAAAAAAAVLAIALYAFGPVEPDTAQPASIAAASTAARPESPGVLKSPQPPPSSRQTEARRAARRPPTPPERRVTAAATKSEPELEVLVPPTQARAIARLRELLKQGVLDGKTLPPPRNQAELVIEPLVVPEIAVPDVEDISGSGVDDTQSVQ